MTGPGCVCIKLPTGQVSRSVGRPYSPAGFPCRIPAGSMPDSPAGSLPDPAGSPSRTPAGFPSRTPTGFPAGPPAGPLPDSLPDPLPDPAGSLPDSPPGPPAGPCRIRLGPGQVAPLSRGHRFPGVTGFPGGQLGVAPRTGCPLDWCPLPCVRWAGVRYPWRACQLAAVSVAPLRSEVTHVSPSSRDRTNIREYSGIRERNGVYSAQNSPTSQNSPG